METVCNKLEKCMMEVKVTFTTEEWKNAQEKALEKLAKNVKIDGFRQGKAPMKMITIFNLLVNLKFKLMN